MSLDLRATDVVGKKESIERRTNTFMGFADSEENLTIT